MKTIKNTKKNTFKPSYVVDITMCDSTNDVILAFADAKQKSGFGITDEELEALIDSRSVVVFIEKQPVKVVLKRKPWYKRFWNWLTRKNK